MFQLLKMISFAGSSAMVGAAAVIAVLLAVIALMLGQQYKVVTVANRAQIEAVANDFAKQGWRLHSFSAPTLIFERK